MILLHVSKFTYQLVSRDINNINTIIYLYPVGRKVGTHILLSNKIMQTLNGNIMKTLSFLQWNKRNSFVRNTIDWIKNILAENKPNIFVVNELNLFRNEDTSLLNVIGYSWELERITQTSNKYSTVMYISNNLIHKRRNDIEDIEIL